MRRLLILTPLLFTLAPIARAQTPPAPSISVEKAWARPTVAAVKTGAAYVTIIDRGAPDRLIGASTPIAGEAGLHETIHDGDVMKMRPVDGLPIPSNSPVTFTPGGYHIMLMGLKQPLKAGQTFALALKFQNAGTVETMVTVRAAAPDAEMPMNMPGMGNMPGMAKP